MGFSSSLTSWRPLVFAVLFIVVPAAVAGAQTVIVQNVLPGETIEVYVNDTKAGSGTADAGGGARIGFDLRAATGADEMDSRVFVDVCDRLRRILIVNRNRQPGVREDACERREILGVFWVRQRSTLVIDAGATIPTMLLRQGRYDPTAGKIRVLAPTGIVVFGGGGIAQFDQPVRLACGTVTECSGDAAVLTFTAGVDLWVTRWLAAEGTYSKPRKIQTEGAGGFFKFTDTYDVHLVTVAAKAGIPVGRARMYGKGGGIFHSATTASETTLDDVTQTLRLRTEGWSWMAGGGIEVWTGRSFALFGDVTYGKIKGSAVGDVEGVADDKVISVMGGFRVKVF